MLIEDGYRHDPSSGEGTSLGLTEDGIFDGFPVKLFVTIVGVTYLFPAARRSGSVDLLVAAGAREGRPSSPGCWLPSC
ncbi:hypothetical protein ACFW6Q_05090 [Streptomyces sp. NPDC058737]|uniref:hypothetical protein n=1 Tax=Streptomyces sp. NPDC058737 TaxID=3346617 RepID=UPI003699FB1B